MNHDKTKDPEIIQKARRLRRELEWNMTAFGNATLEVGEDGHVCVVNHIDEQDMVRGPYTYTYIDDEQDFDLTPAQIRNVMEPCEVPSWRRNLTAKTAKHGPWTHYDEADGITPEQLDSIFTEPMYLDPCVTRQSGKTRTNMWNTYKEMLGRAGHIKRSGYIPAYDERDVHLLALELAINGGR